MRANLKPNRYSQYETGVQALTIDAALTICNEYGISLDWLYRGDRSRLPIISLLISRALKPQSVTINHKSLIVKVSLTISPFCG